MKVMTARDAKNHFGEFLDSARRESIKQIDEQSNNVLTVVGDITNALREQSVASNEIARRVEQMAQMTEENSASVRQTAAAAQQLDTVSSALEATSHQFKVR